MGFHIRRKEDSNFTLFSYGFLIIGLVTWLCWLPLFTDILSWSRESEGFIILVLVVISVWFWRLYAIYINWVPCYFASLFYGLQVIIILV